MAGHQMPAELVADLQRTLEIELGALPPGARGGQAQRLRARVRGEPRAPALLAGAHHRETDAGTGDRGAVGDPCARVAAGDREAVQILRPRLDAQHFADVGDDAREHDACGPSCSIVGGSVRVYHARSKNSTLSSPTGSRPSAVNRAVIASIRRPSSASTPSGPMVLGERNSAAASTRSAATKAAATVGPPSTINRVMPPPASI